MNDNNNASFERHPDLNDRQAAEKTLCRFFKSFGLDALAERDRLIDPFLDRAGAYWRPNAGLDFAALALQEAEDALETWCADVLGEQLEDRAAAIMTGRAAFLMCRGPKRFQDQFLRSVDALDAAFIEAMIDHAPRAVPPSELGEMHHQPYEAWSPSAVVAYALPPIERVAGFSWRNTGPTS